MQVVYRTFGLFAVAVGTVLAVDGLTRAESVLRELTRHIGAGVIVFADL